MSIPKKIHYCWFGRNPLPESAKKCIESWKKYCPEYEIIEWNEDNFDLTENRYAREAYEQKKWAFVSDLYGRGCGADQTAGWAYRAGWLYGL